MTTWKYSSNFILKYSLIFSSSTSWIKDDWAIYISNDEKKLQYLCNLPSLISFETYFCYNFTFYANFLTEFFFVYFSTKLCFIRHINSFSSGRDVAILSGVVLNANIFQTIHHMETEIASFERRELPLSNDFNFITSLVDIITCINYDIKCCNYA